MQRKRYRSGVEYALARNTSPALIAEYETKLIDKKILSHKLNQLVTILNKRRRIMTVTEIRQILESPYDRSIWKNFLQNTGLPIINSIQKTVKFLCQITPLAKNVLV